MRHYIWIFLLAGCLLGGLPTRAQSTRYWVATLESAIVGLDIEKNVAHLLLSKPGSTDYFVDIISTPDGKCYGLTLLGGKYNMGTLFEFDPHTWAYTVKVDFDGTTTGSAPQKGLVFYKGKIYGQCGSGGAQGKGTLFCFDPQRGQIDLLRSVGGDIPGGKLQPILLTPEGQAYACTTEGGKANLGQLLSLDLEQLTATVSIEFSSRQMGGLPRGFMCAMKGKIYGIGVSSLFSFNPTTKGLLGLAQFPNNYVTDPYNGVWTGGDGIIYGLAGGGLYGYDPNDGSMRVVAGDYTSHWSPDQTKGLYGYDGNGRLHYINQGTMKTISLDGNPYHIAEYASSMCSVPGFRVRRDAYQMSPLGKTHTFPDGKSWTANTDTTYTCALAGSPIDTLATTHVATYPADKPALWGVQPRMDNQPGFELYRMETNGSAVKHNMHVWAGERYIANEVKAGKDGKLYGKLIPWHNPKDIPQIFTIDLQTGAYQAVNVPQLSSHMELAVSSSGLLYNPVSGGKLRIDPFAGDITLHPYNKLGFDVNTAEYCNLEEAPDGYLYALREGGWSPDDSRFERSIFRVDPVSMRDSLMLNMTSGVVGRTLLMGNNGMMYGLYFGAESGMLRYDPKTNQVAKLPLGDAFNRLRLEPFLMKGPGGKLYGVGSGQEYGKCVVFAYEPGRDDVEIRITEDVCIDEPMTLSEDGRFYGVATKDYRWAMIAYDPVTRISQTIWNVTTPRILPPTLASGKVERSPKVSRTIAQLCAGGDYTFPDGSIYRDVQDTLRQHSWLQGPQGESLLSITDLEVLPPLRQEEHVDFCGGEFTFPDKRKRMINGNTTYISHLRTADGCDSLVTTHITLKPEPVEVKASYAGLECTDKSGVSYQWYNSVTGQPIPGANAYTYPWSWDNDYQEVSLRMRLPSGCIKQSMMSFSRPEKITGLDGPESAWRVFPNPSEGEVRIQPPYAYPWLQVSVYDALGRLLDTYHFKQQQSASIALPATSGLYLLEMRYPDGKKTIRVSRR